MIMANVKEKLRDFLRGWEVKWRKAEEEIGRKTKEEK